MYEQGIKLEPTDVRVYNNAAWLCATADDPEVRNAKKAIEYGKKAVYGSREKDPSYLDTLAEAYYVNGKFKKAIETIRKAISLEPQNEYFKKQLKKFEQPSGLN